VPYSRSGQRGWAVALGSAMFQVAGPGSIRVPRAALPVRGQSQAYGLSPDQGQPCKHPVFNDGERTMCRGLSRSKGRGLRRGGEGLTSGTGLLGQNLFAI